MDAIIQAIEASIAFDYDPLGGKPDWSISPHHFWMQLADQGYEVTKRHNDGPEVGG